MSKHISYPYTEISEKGVTYERLVDQCNECRKLEEYHVKEALMCSKCFRKKLESERKHRRLDGTKKQREYMLNYTARRRKSKEWENMNRTGRQGSLDL